MGTLPSTAREARRLAQLRHRNQLLVWKVIAGASVVTAVVACVTCYFSFSVQGWRTDRAMPMQRVEVIVDGFVDKNGEWRSFDNGERISVQQWKP